MPVDDARAVEVVGRQLDADAVAREDADAEAPHLSGHVAEHRVVVVEPDAKHRVREGLDHLTLELDLVLLGHGGRTVPPPRAGLAVLARGAGGLLAAGGLRAATLGAVAVAVVARGDLGRRLVGAGRVLRRVVLGGGGRGTGALPGARSGAGRRGRHALHAGRVGRGRGAPAAGAAVVPEERRRLERRGGLLELAAEAALGRLHVG